jgi:hypothetical protein
MPPGGIIKGEALIWLDWWNNATPSFLVSGFSLSTIQPINHPVQPSTELVSTGPATFRETRMGEVSNGCSESLGN